MIDLTNVRVKRGGFALEIPSWKVEPGRVIGVVGPNGAGKSTLLELLVGLRAPNAGTVRCFGLDPVKKVYDVRTQLGYMTDDMPIFALRVGALMRRVGAYYPTWDDALARELMARFELDPEQKTTALSKGQGTRVRLVLALAYRPKVVILDEPGTGLDVSGRRALMKTVLEVVRDPARTVIVSSHALEDVHRLSDELLVLAGGRVVQQGRADALVADGVSLEEALIGWGAA